MLKLSANPTFQYELLRVLGLSRDRGSDVGEHCHVGASDMINSVVMDWLEGTLATVNGAGLRLHETGSLIAV